MKRWRTGAPPFSLNEEVEDGGAFLHSLNETEMEIEIDIEIEKKDRDRYRDMEIEVKTTGVRDGGSTQKTNPLLHSSLSQ